MQLSDKEIYKSELRQKYMQIAKTSYLEPRVNENIIEFIKSIVKPNAIIGAYCPLSTEPNIEKLSHDPNYKFAFPRVEGDELKFFKLGDKGTWLKSDMGMDEPDPTTCEPIPNERMAAIIVPGVAFDRKLKRLGRGKGFYDRFLKQYPGLKIGVCSVSQVVNEDIVTDVHDEDVDVLVTENYILRRFNS